MSQPRGNNVVDPQRILFIRWKSIGDIIQTLPAWNALRAAFPWAHITFMTSAENAALVRLFPGVDAVLAFDRHSLFLQKHAHRFADSWRILWRSSLGGHFDLVVDMQGYGETAFLTFLSRAKERWGLLTRRNRAYAYTWAVARKDTGHVADCYIEVLKEKVGASAVSNRLTLTAPILDAARALLKNLGIDLTNGRPLVCIHPVSSGPHKIWPLDRYAQVAAHAEQQGFQVVITGGPADRAPLARSPLGHWPIACGQELTTSCGIASLARLIIGGDTGLLHAAQATGTRVLMIMASDAAERSGPYQRPEWAVTSPSLATLPVDTVLRALDQSRLEPGNQVPGAAVPRLITTT